MDHFQDHSSNPEARVNVMDAESKNSGYDNGTMSLRVIHILRLYWLRRRLFLTVLIVGLFLTVVYAYEQPNIYTSTTSLMPPESASSSSSLVSLLSSAPGAAASVGSSILGVKTPGAVFVGILQSRTVLESLVDRFDLTHYYKVRLSDDACARLASATHITEELKSGIIEINVSDKNPDIASEIARGYVEELNSVVNHNSTSAARRERLFLEERLKEIKQDLDNSSAALSQFSSRNRTIDIPTEARDMVDAGLKLQSELTTARSELAGLRQIYSDDNVRVRSALAKVNELQIQMDKLNGTPQGNVSPVDTNNSGYPSVEQLPALGLTYTDLDRRVHVEEALWEALTKQYEAAKVEEAKEIPTVRVLDTANVPQHKSSHRSPILFLGMIMSSFAACASVIGITVWEEMDEEDERKKFINGIKSSFLEHVTKV